MSDEDVNPKLPDGVVINDDPDGNTLCFWPSTHWWVWVTSAFTVFVRGMLAGLFLGVAGAVGVVANTDSINTGTLIQNGSVGFVIGLFLKGLERYHNWQAKTENEMPNPFRP